MRNLPDILVERVKRPVAVLGLGVSGRAVVSRLNAAGVRCVMYDRKGSPDGAVRTVFDERAASAHDLAVYSPGFAQNHPWLRAARASGALCLGEMDFSSLFWSGRFVCVTGTNGKTTLTDFLATALRANGGEALAVGNIGQPLSGVPELSESRGAVAVCEISSFQAEGLQCLRPDALLWTNFEEDHLDRYPDMRAYFAAKWNLVERLAQPRFFIGAQTAQWAEKLGYTLPSFTHIVRREDGEGLIPENSPFLSYPQRENYLLARAYWLDAGLPIATLEEAARRFSLRRHRLAPVAVIDGVAYWNDSKGTNFHAVEAALKTFDKPVLWIGGGHSKGGDLGAFAARIAPRVKAAYLTGETAPELARHCAQQGVKHACFDTLEAAVRAVHAEGKNGDIALFSPGFSSFDHFANYAERGVCFESCVLGLKKANDAR